MKSIRKYLKSISSLLAFLVLLVSCTQYDSSVDDDLAINQSNGEELFKGIFFGNGPIASKLSNYASSLSFMYKHTMPSPSFVKSV